MAHFDAPARLAPLLARVDAISRARGLAAYAVGGSVRDALLGRELRDVDMAVDRDAMAFARTLADALSGHFVALDDEHVVARVVLDDAAIGYVDVAMLQGSLEEDLRRRDFTVDALAAPLTGGEVIDVSGGLEDLAGRRLRMTSERALDDDPLRVLRGARIAAELSFAIDSATAVAIRARAQAMMVTAAERRRDELARIFALERAGAGLRLLDELGLLEALLPEVTAGRGVTQPAEFHAFDVLEHNIAAVEAMDAMLGAKSLDGGVAGWMHEDLWRIFAWRARDLRAYLDEELSEGRTRGSLLKLAALLHDVAKPQRRSVGADGRVRFLGHADEGASAAASIMRRYRFSAREAQFVATLVREHLRPAQLAQIGEVPSLRALYRFHRDAGDALQCVLLLALADAAAARGARLTREGWSRQAAYMNNLLVRLQGEEGIVRAPRLVSGHDIMSEFRLAEGPRIGQLLEAVREAEATAEVHDREGALAFVRALLDETDEPV